jgi:hypothetical protein
MNSYGLKYEETRQFRGESRLSVDDEYGLTKLILRQPREDDGGEVLGILGTEMESKILFSPTAQ